MARYIDADEFLKQMIAKFKCVPLLGVVGCNRWGEECFEGEHLDALINTTPTADAGVIISQILCDILIKKGVSVEDANEISFTLMQDLETLIEEALEECQ